MISCTIEVHLFTYLLRRHKHWSDAVVVWLKRVTILTGLDLMPNSEPCCRLQTTLHASHSVDRLVASRAISFGQVNWPTSSGAAVGRSYRTESGVSTRQPSRTSGRVADGPPADGRTDGRTLTRRASKMTNRSLSATPLRSVILPQRFLGYAPRSSVFIYYSPIKRCGP